MHLHWITRQANGNAVAGAPVELKVLKPNGQELSKETVTLTALGTGGFDLATDKMYPTGRYEAQLYVPGRAHAHGPAYTFRVEDFVPNRLKSTVTVDQPVWRVDQEYPVKVNAQHLFGAPPPTARSARGWSISAPPACSPIGRASASTTTAPSRRCACLSVRRAPMPPATPRFHLCRRRAARRGAVAPSGSGHGLAGPFFMSSPHTLHVAAVSPPAESARRGLKRWIVQSKGTLRVGASAIPPPACSYSSVG
ncbi:MAG: hypothetical protein HC888_15330 [Candidatus Competibacteraceae bacterium]|nr:hypothetical protein [Candidatus Competibacteraceae bacterium]